jgi:chromosome segregation ATPase
MDSAPVIIDNSMNNLDFMNADAMNKLKQREELLIKFQSKLNQWNDDLNSKDAQLSAARSELNLDVDNFNAVKSKFSLDFNNFNAAKMDFENDQANYQKALLKLAEDRKAFESAQAELNALWAQLEADRAKLVEESSNLINLVEKLKMNKNELESWWVSLRAEQEVLFNSQKQLQWDLERLSSDQASYSAAKIQLDKDENDYAARFSQWNASLSALEADNALWLQKKLDWESSWAARSADFDAKVNSFNIKIEQWTISLNVLESHVIEKEKNANNLQSQNDQIMIEINILREENKNMIIKITEIEALLDQMRLRGVGKILVGSSKGSKND